MAIQLPNPGLGDGQTGDNEFVMWTKVKDNFTDQTNAASRLVGVGAGKIPLYEQVSRAFGAVLDVYSPNGADQDFNDLTGGTHAYIGAAALNYPASSGSGIHYIRTDFIRGESVSEFLIQHSFDRTNGERYFRGRSPSGWGAWQREWHSGNATKDANGFLKAASPIVKVFADKTELNDDAVNQNVTYKRNGVGDYTITTVSGLSTDGWYIELPKDMNGNPKVAVTLSEIDGVISLKTYKRIFSMETFTFEPDLDNPLDIPDSRWVDIRLNEIPVDMPEDMQTEV